MYKAYYGFTHYPFSKDIPTNQFMQYKGFMEYQKRMDFLKKHGGIGVVWGQAGSGKSVGLRWLRDSLNKNRFRFFYLSEPPASVSSFYRQLALAMDLKPAFRRIEIYYQIQDYINNLSAERKITPIIALDECQMYPHTVLEAVRLFLNFDMDSKQNVILILAGQQEFRKRLGYAVYEPLTQRVTVQHHFEGLSDKEVDKYMTHRFAVTGVKHQLFEPAAIQFIYQVTKGILRKIDILSVQSLHIAAELKKKSIDQSIVETALKENIWT